MTANIIREYLVNKLGFSRVAVQTLSIPQLLELVDSYEDLGKYES